MQQGKGLTVAGVHLQQGSTNPEYEGTQQDLPDKKKDSKDMLADWEVKVRS
jgi:carbonic anhydrase